MSQSDIFMALDHGLKQAGSVQTPGETHGTLTGMLCIDNEQPPAAAVDDVEAENLTAALEALREMTLEGLFDPDLSFTPLLPDDDEHSLDRRVNALARWCSGFLFGLSYRGRFDPDQLSDEVREIVTDLTELSKAELTAEEDADSAEADYAELVEYVRVGVQMIFLELQPRREGPETRETLH
ncbi:UPF0149 family protein [Salinisphaera sp. LB1]|uniref:UPF0149 family protein n=1 Tax=Salinisphaera sp. LB1 TaxID=2183911 RepID=UPI000D7087C2|nr:UPF0149 family protein [Salinisphaera sp. LB1]AWN17806.1 Putative conserved exported protein precursor [Salinisphaera sp. LB1]